MAEEIICRFVGDQWLAHFERKPQVAFGGDMPVRAVRRLLEGTDAAPGAYTLLCDRDLSGSGILSRDITWDPPELLRPCPDCGGRGRYTGLHDVESCRTCGGRKVVPA